MVSTVLDYDGGTVTVRGNITNEQVRRLQEVLAPVAGVTRVTDPVTGAQKDQKLAQLGALDPGSLMTLAKVAGFGAQKYARGNYLKGYAWSLSFDAMMRHMLAFQMGETNDPESGLPHTAHAAWHALALTAFVQRSLGTDDRAT